MTRVYFVRHAQPEHAHADDRTRPLTAEGTADAELVWQVLRDKGIDAFYCSPYKRSIDTIQTTAERLDDHEGQAVAVGTHGTALSAIINYYVPAFGCDDFLRIIDWMPYIVELDFDGQRFLSMTEHGHVEKQFKPV